MWLSFCFKCLNFDALKSLVISTVNLACILLSLMCNTINIMHNPRHTYIFNLLSCEAGFGFLLSRRARIQISTFGIDYYIAQVRTNVRLHPFHRYSVNFPHTSSQNEYMRSWHVMLFSHRVQAKSEWFLL